MDRRAHFIIAVLTALEATLTGIVFFTSDDWKGTCQGQNLKQKSRLFAQFFSYLLFLSSVANVTGIIWQIVYSPEDVNGKDEIGISAVGLGVLWWTDIFCWRKRISRRRFVADCLAQFPTFRFHRGYKRNRPMNKEGYKEKEFVIRSASVRIRNAGLRQKGKLEQYWRGQIIAKFFRPNFFEDYGGSMVVLHDYAAQDEAGCDLLTPIFTHKPELRRQLIANVVFKTLVRSQIWNISKWDTTGTRWNEGGSFTESVIDELICVQAINVMRKNELWQNITEDTELKGYFGRLYDDPGSYLLVQCVWAAICHEIFEYLDPARNENRAFRMDSSKCKSCLKLDDESILGTFVGFPLKVKDLNLLDPTSNWDLNPLIRACQSFAREREAEQEVQKERDEFEENFKNAAIHSSWKKIDDLIRDMKKKKEV